MKHSSPKPQVFVGASVESLKVAHAVQENLEHDARVIVWDQGVFGLSKQTLDSLEKQLAASDFAIFILGPDDQVKFRSKASVRTRDNVIFELGLFIGRLGRERTYWLVPRDVSNFQVPSDLMGLTPAQYESPEDDNWPAAVGTACTKVRREIKALGKRSTPEGPEKGFVLHETGRVSVEDTVRLMDGATSSITVVGSTLRSWVGYFDRTPASKFKHPVQRLVENGINFRFYFLDPDSDAATTYANDRRDEAIDEIRESIDHLREIAGGFNGARGSIEVFVYSRFPFGYVLLVDPDTSGKAFVSPYLPGLSRADCPYIEIDRSLSPDLYDRYHEAIKEITDTSHCRRLYGSVNKRRRVKP